jgi:hypothetical protein
MGGQSLVKRRRSDLLQPRTREFFPIPVSFNIDARNGARIVQLFGVANDHTIELIRELVEWARSVSVSVQKRFGEFQ